MKIIDINAGNVVYDGSLLSYHYLTRKEFLNRLARIRKLPND
jgi:hypothetical protein